MSAQPEVWRVSTVEGVFETDLETLQQWIIEGCVLPTDKVSKGTLNWIEAGRVPKLKPIFNGEVVSPPPTSPVIEAPPPQRSAEPVENFNEPRVENSTQVATPPALSNACHNHPDVAPEYVCKMCGAAFCRDCPRFVSNTPICPLCGDLCRRYQEIRTRSAQVQFQGSGFGMSDFTRALAYPFQHKIALLCGALLYGFLLLAGFRGSVLAWMIMFGCISHVISQVAWGRLNRSFMPDFSAFSLWDDLILPIFLGLGIMIVTWGPVIALVLALVFGAVRGGAKPPTSIAGGPQTSAGPTQQDLGALADPEADPKKLEEASKKLDQLRPGVPLVQEAERSRKEQSDPAANVKMLLPYLGAGFVVLLLLLVGIAWAIFYYPMALTVAGYTQSFGSVVNPLVGLDTIRRMGATYFKAFGMVLAIQVVALIVGGIVAMITSPFALPFIGNLPANFINGTFTFYFNLVIACVLGLSLYKCADRLGISVN